jgi:aminomethyltransferase
MNAVGLDVSIEDISERTGALALQGPSSRTILEQLTPDDVATLKYFRLVHTTIRHIPVTISRTGYTGDLGYELWVDAEHAVALWDALIEVGTPYGITPAGIWALDLARIEAGLVMLDVDYFSAHRAVIEDQKSSPFELNLAWTVSADKGPHNGRRALRAERVRGFAWCFVGLDVDWVSLERIYAERGLPPQLPTVAWRTSAPIYKEGKQIGYATSGCWSPLLKKYLALAHIMAPNFAPGNEVELEVTVEHRRKRANAVVKKLPFFDPPRKKE